MRCRAVLPALIVLTCVYFASPADAARWSAFTSADGLPTAGVEDLAQSTDGTIWAATGGGLARYRRLVPGEGWQVVVSGDFDQVTVDGRGVVWASTVDGQLDAYDEDGTALPVPDLGLVGSVIRDLQPEGDDGLLLATDVGLLRVEGLASQPTSTLLDGGFDVETVAVARDGSLWWTTRPRGGRRTRVVRWDDGTTTERELVDQSLAAFASALTPLSDGYAIVATSAGAVRLVEPTALQLTPAAIPGAAGFFDDALEDGTGRVFLARQDEVVLIERATAPDDPTGWHYELLTNQAGLSGNVVADILEATPVATEPGLAAGGRELWFATDLGISVQSGQPWLTFRAAEGAFLGPGCVGGCESIRVIDAAPDGSVWFGARQGLSRRDPDGMWDAWTRDAFGGDLLEPFVRDVEIDADGTVWIATGAASGNGLVSTSGLQRYREGAFTTIGSGDPSWRVWSIARASDDRLWLGTDAGVVSLDTSVDPPVPTLYDAADGLPWQPITAIEVDDGLLVAAADSGLARWNPDDATWTLLPLSDLDRTACRDDATAGRILSLAIGTDLVAAATRVGLVLVDRTATSLSDATVLDDTDGLDCRINSIAIDVDGGWLLGGASGIQRIVPELDRIGTVGPIDGLPGQVVSVLTRRTDEIWMGFAGDGAAVHRFEAPETAITQSPPAVVVDPQAPLLLRVATADPDDDPNRLRLELRVDDGPWNSVGSGPAVAFAPAQYGAGHGPHRLEVRAVDPGARVDRSPARADFEIDAIVPAPILLRPASGDAVRGTVDVVGTSTDVRFARARVDATRGSTGESRVISDWSTIAVAEALLSTWVTTEFDDDEWTLRLAVEDTLGVLGTAQVTVLVDNLPPFAARTSPVEVDGADGGIVSSIDGAATVYVPALAFDGRRTVTVRRVDDGASLGGSAFEVAGIDGTAAATLRLRLPPDAEDSQTSVWRLDGTAVTALGGTLESTDGDRFLATPVPESGTYALRTGDPDADGDAAPLAEFDVQPRYLDPRTGGFDGTVDIRFRLARESSVRAVVYGRNGSARRVIEDGRRLGPGQHVLQWDGRDHDGEWVATGLYIVQLEVGDERRTQVVGVGRR